MTDSQNATRQQLREALRVILLWCGRFFVNNAFCFPGCGCLSMLKCGPTLSCVTISAQSTSGLLGLVDSWEHMLLLILVLGFETAPSILRFFAKLPCQSFASTRTWQMILPRVHARKGWTSACKKARQCYTYGCNPNHPRLSTEFHFGYLDSAWWLACVPWSFPKPPSLIGALRQSRHNATSRDL